MKAATHPLVSVVIPTYNHAHFLGRALQSVLDQTYPNWEVILIDNHSEVHFVAPGKKGSLLGRLDALLSNNAGVLGWFARQRSFYCKKPLSIASSKGLHNERVKNCGI